MDNIKKPIVVFKESLEEFTDRDIKLTKLIYAYVSLAAFWLIFGTLIGEYLGIRFVWPDFGVEPWLSFGRLRPIHTNTVFWGWASLGMIALALYVIPKTSRNKLYSIKLAWVSLLLINASVVIGDLCLFMGINNGNQEYREYIWPVMSIFAAGLILLVYNLYQTIAHRKLKDIYVSNWYIMAAFIWTITLVIIAYLPFYQNGLGETVIQGYLMHMGVGMWFTPMVLGLTYYFLPKLLNKPIYSYSLGVLAFWTQMTFYTMLGAHHFVFSPIPWWLQTVAIVFSFGMFVPVIAGTGNFLLTMKGEGNKIAKSYSLPFILTSIILYFLVSAQGSFEALRTLNRYWHFTNYTIAHSHIAMYGFISFGIWGGIYGLIPRLTGKEPKHIYIGMHFWFALIGLIIYAVSLMIGGTLQGASWMTSLPFIHSVKLMAPYWLWRAVGGTLMFFANVVFAYNVWLMRPQKQIQ